MFVTVSIMFD